LRLTFSACTAPLRLRHLYDLFRSPFFFFNDTATTEIYTLSLHDALPIYVHEADAAQVEVRDAVASGVVDLRRGVHGQAVAQVGRSEEHTSELQSQSNLVCRLLLEKKKKNKKI